MMNLTIVHRCAIVASTLMACGPAPAAPPAPVPSATVAAQSSPPVSALTPPQLAATTAAVSSGIVPTDEEAERIPANGEASVIDYLSVGAHGSSLLGMEMRTSYLSDDGSQFSVVWPDESTPELGRSRTSYWLRVYSTAKSEEVRRFRIWDPAECYARSDEPCQSNRERRSLPITQYLRRHKWFIAHYWDVSGPYVLRAGGCEPKELRRSVSLGIYRIVYEPPRVVVIRDDGTTMLDKKVPHFVNMSENGCQRPGQPYLSSVLLDERIGVVVVEMASCSYGECGYPAQYLSARLPADGRKSDPELSTPIVPPPPPEPPPKSTLTKTGGETE